jgi:hypothetical protein
MRAYALHCVAPHGTYYVDLVMFRVDDIDRPWGAEPTWSSKHSRDYYLFVEGNTRYSAIYPANTVAFGYDWGFDGRGVDHVRVKQVAYKIVGGSQSTEAYRRCLEAFLRDFGPRACKLLRGDAQHALTENR